MSDNATMVIDLKDNQQYQELLAGAPMTKGMRSGRVYLQCGQDCGTHTTGRHEEMLVFLQGKGVVELADGKQMPVAAGKVSYIGPDTEHNVRCSGTEPLAYIYCVAPVQIDS